MSSRAAAPFSFQRLPSDLAVHALRFLGEMDDLVHTAATCSGLHDLVWSHWRVLQPRKLPFLQRFLDPLKDNATLRRNAHLIPLLKEIAAQRQSPDDPLRPFFAALAAGNHLARRRLHFAAGQSQRLFDADAAFTPRVIRRLRLLTPGKYLPVLEIAGANVLGFGRAEIPTRLFAAPDGSLDLTQFGWILYPFVIWEVRLTCFADTEAVVEEVPVDRLPYTLAEGERPHQWPVRQVSWSHWGYVFPVLRSVKLRLTHNFPAEYLAVYFESHRPRQWLPVHQAPQVAQFRLSVSVPGLWDALPPLPGWACRHADHYRIPLKGLLNFSLIDTATLTIDFKDDVPPNAVVAHVVALTTNVQTFGGAGTAFNN